MAHNFYEELVTAAIDSISTEVVIPDTGTLAGDINALIENAAQITLSPLGRQSVGTLVASAASNPAFARIYWLKYLEPRRQAFAVVIDRAKVRNEVDIDLDPGLVFDTIGGIMLYALIFQPASESWSTDIRRALDLLFNVSAAAPVTSIVRERKRSRRGSSLPTS